MALPKNNLRATAAPQATDDSSQGYSIGSTWFNQTTGALWVARNVTANAAEWTFQNIGRDAWPSNSYRFPDNFGGGFQDITPTNIDALFLFPFIITRPIARAGVALTTAGSTGATVAFGLYANDPSAGKPDGMAKIASIGATALDTGSGTVRATGAISFDAPPGIYWLGAHLKNVTTMPILKGMKEANGRHIHGASGAEVLAGTALQCRYAATGYTGSTPNPCPTTSTPVGTASPAPMPFILSA